MSCPILSTDFTIDCAKAQGGIKRILIAELASIDSISVASGVATITKGAGKRFYQYKVTLGGGSLTSVPTPTRATGALFYLQTVTMNLPKFDVAKRNEMQVLTLRPTVVIVEDMEGSYWLAGAVNGLENGGGGFNSGTASGDGNMYAITLTGEEKEDVYKVESSAIAALLTA
jgi:hypothetical protein